MENIKQLLDACLEAAVRKDRFTYEVTDDMIRLIPVNDMFTQADIMVLTRFANENGLAFFVSHSYVDNKLRWIIYEPMIYYK